VNDRQEPEPWSALITEARILALHKRALAEHGGLPGGPQTGCVSAKLGGAWAAEGYVGGEAGIEGLTFATYLAFYLAKGHCFNDANKRVAWLAVVDVLAVLGLRVDAAQKDAADFVERVASLEGADARPEIVREWVTARLAEVET